VGLGLQSDDWVGERSVNPLSQLSNRRLVGTVLDRVEQAQSLGGVEELSDLREVGVRDVTVLGESVELVSYRGMAEVDGQQVAVVVNLLAVEHGDDVVVALGVHEASLDETATHARLVEAIEHAARDGDAEN
jgi:Flp pilus assembly secretin CpaC